MYVRRTINLLQKKTVVSITSAFIEHFLRGENTYWKYRSSGWSAS